MEDLKKKARIIAAIVTTMVIIGMGCFMPQEVKAQNNAANAQKMYDLLTKVRKNVNSKVEWFNALEATREDFFEVVKYQLAEGVQCIGLDSSYDTEYRRLERVIKALFKYDKVAEEWEKAGSDENSPLLKEARGLIEIITRGGFNMEDGDVYDPLYESSIAINDLYSNTARKSKGILNNQPSTSTSPRQKAITVEIEMVFVQGGTFTMGCTSEQGDDCFDDEKTVHRVTLSDYYIGKYEVTQGQ